MNSDSALTTPLETPRERTPAETIPNDNNNTNRKIIADANTGIINDNEKEIKDNKVLPWDMTDHEIKIKSFSGYTVKLNGWIRHDIREQRMKEAKEKELERNKEKEKNENTRETTKEQEKSIDKDI